MYQKNKLNIILSINIFFYYEINKIKNLLKFISSQIEYIYYFYEINIININKQLTKELIDIINEFNNLKINYYYYDFINNKDFSKLKNYAKSISNGKYIFHLDADELPPILIFKYFNEIIEIFNYYDIIYIPKINIINYFTYDDLIENNWKIVFFSSTDNRFIKVYNKNNICPYLINIIKDLIIKEENDNLIMYAPIINWPNYVDRLYINKEDIYWINNVNEILVSKSNKYYYLPDNIDWAIYYDVDIKEYKNKKKFIDNIK